MCMDASLGRELTQQEWEGGLGGDQLPDYIPVLSRLSDWHRVGFMHDH